MKTKMKLGIVGGMGSQASAWLLQRIVNLCAVQKDQEYLEIVLHSNSAIPDRTRAIVHNEDSPLSELLRSVKLLNQNNIDVAVLACMTAYYYCPDLIPFFPGKIMNPLDLVKEELNRNKAFNGKKKIGLIGSTGMLKSKIYNKVLEPQGYEIITLNDQDQEDFFMRPIYMPGGIKSGSLSEEVKNMFLYQVHLLKEKGSEIIVGACSEVPLIMNKDNIDLPFIDAFDLLARKVVDYCYNKQN